MRPTVEPELPFPAPPPAAEPAAGASDGTVSKSKAGARFLLSSFGWKVRLAVYAVSAVSAGAACWLAAMLVYYTVAFPDPQSVRTKDRGTVIRVLARDGTTLSERGAANAFIPIDMLPAHVVGAIVATEDRRFFSHLGVDPGGLIRAAFANLRAGRFVQGGSTITQQLAKNLFLSSERTMSRKLDELAIAFWLEVRLSKREILELYVNRVYFGGGAYGIEAAAQRYFDKSARALSIPESALLAGLLKAPSKYAPTSSPSTALARQKVVLAKMREAGAISDTDYRVAMKTTLRFANLGHARTAATGFEYAVDLVLENLPSVLGDDHDELIVETTIDAHLQRHANQQVEAYLAGRGKTMKASQAALISIDVDGGVRALVGGRSYAKSQFNRATKARRQPGSVFKPFVYLSALEAGMTPDTITYDLPLTIDGWSPRNDNGSNLGALTLRQAIAQSINTVAVRLGMDVGLSTVAATARRLGIQSTLREDPSLALGTSEVSLIDLVGAYGVLASGGTAVQPHIINRVRLSSGRVLFARAPEPAERVVDLQHVGAMNDMLNAALVAGTGRRAALPRHPAAGKTGTTQDFRDAWFIGYTGHFTTGIWVGNDDGRPMARVMGGNLPAEIWHAVMLESHRGRNAVALPGTSSTMPASNREAEVPLARTEKPEILPWHARKAPSFSSHMVRHNRSGTQIRSTGQAVARGRATVASSIPRPAKPVAAVVAAPLPTRPGAMIRIRRDIGARRARPIGQRIVVEPPADHSPSPARAEPATRSPPAAARIASPTAPAFPRRSIDAEFIDRVLAADTPPASPSAVAARPSGFDVDEIRRQLDGLAEDQTAVRAAPRGLMSLGAARR
ncbi:MAG: PBP1A family penicillin-binding protein [Hyphomicrobiaceae bacterium]|nr:PBP1A family penicillin-binding protein [Hyphomicrobiaceae bacterium]